MRLYVLFFLVTASFLEIPWAFSSEDKMPPGSSTPDEKCTNILKLSRTQNRSVDEVIRLARSEMPEHNTVTRLELIEAAKHTFEKTLERKRAAAGSQPTQEQLQSFEESMARVTLLVKKADSTDTVLETLVSTLHHLYRETRGRAERRFYRKQIPGLLKEIIQHPEFGPNAMSALLSEIQRPFAADMFANPKVVEEHLGVFLKSPILKESNLVKILDILVKSTTMPNVVKANFLMLCLRRIEGNLEAWSKFVSTLRATFEALPNEVRLFRRTIVMAEKLEVKNSEMPKVEDAFFELMTALVSRRHTLEATNLLDLAHEAVSSRWAGSDTLDLLAKRAVEFAQSGYWETTEALMFLEVVDVRAEVTGDPVLRSLVKGLRRELKKIQR
ncbi:MAG: hypothetical protein AB1540_03310 [Bdellovibrionota bacterium]